MSGILPFLLALAAPPLSSGVTVKVDAPACSSRAVLAVENVKSFQVFQAQGSSCQFRFEGVFPGKAFFRAEGCGYVVLEATAKEQTVPCPKVASFLFRWREAPAEKPPMQVKLSYRERVPKPLLEVARSQPSALPPEVLEARWEKEGFSLSGFPLGDNVLVDVELVPQGFVAARWQGLPLGEPQRVFEAHFDPGRTLCGQVVAGHRPDDEELGVLFSWDQKERRRVAVGHDGSFCSPPLPLGAPVTAWAASQYGEGPTVQVGAGEAPPLRLEPPEVSLLQGRVRRRESGEAVTDFWLSGKVVASARAAQELVVLPQRRIEDQDGRFSLPRPFPVLPLKLHVEAAGLAPVDVLVENQREVEVVLDVPSVLRVRVTDRETSQPLAGASVTVASRSGSRAAAVTDGEGQATLTVSAGESLTVTVLSQGFCPGSATVTSGAEDEVMVFLQRAAPVHGDVVVEGSGQPAPGATVRVRQGEEVVAETRTGPDGGFSFPAGCGASWATVEASMAGYAPARAPLMADGPLRLVLKPLRSLRGRVTGLPPGWPSRLTLAFLTGEAWQVPLDVDHSFAAEGIPGDTVLWTVRPEGLPACNGTLQLARMPEPMVELPCDRGWLRLSGFLRQATGLPVGDGVLSLHEETPEGRSLVERTRPDGGFAFQGLRPGRYKLLASREGYLPVLIWRGLLEKNLELNLHLPDLVPLPASPEKP